MFYFLSLFLFFLFKTKSTVICSIYLESQHFSLFVGGVKHGKVEHMLQLLLAFLLSDSVVSFAIFRALASAMMTRLSSCRLVKKSNKPFWQTGWIEAVRSLCFLESCLSFIVYIVYIHPIWPYKGTVCIKESIFISLVFIDFFVLLLSTVNAWVDSLWQANRVLEW